MSMVCAWLGLFHAQAAVVALYDFGTGDSEDTGNLFDGQPGLSSADSELNSTASALTTGGPQGLDGGGANNIFSTNNPPDAGEYDNPHSNWGNGDNAEASANFAQFTIEPTAGFQINYESLSLFHGAYDNTPKFKITYAIGAGPDTVALGPTTHTVVGNGPALEFTSEDFIDFSTDQTVTWKIHIFDAGSEQIGTRLDDITINGTVSVIPEPSTSLLFGIGALALLFRRRRRCRL
jgi:hypothetical protein